MGDVANFEIRPGQGLCRFRWKPRTRTLHIPETKLGWPTSARRHSPTLSGATDDRPSRQSSPALQQGRKLPLGQSFHSLGRRPAPRPRASSRATLNCAARILRRTWRAISLRDAGSVLSFPSGVLKVSEGDGNSGGVRCASRTTASGVWRPRASSRATRSRAARIPLRIRRMVSSLDSRASSSAADIGSPLSVRCIHHLREVHNRQGFASPRRKTHELWEGRRDGSQPSLAQDGVGATNQILGTGFRRVKTSVIPTSRKF